MMRKCVMRRERRKRERKKIRDENMSVENGR